MHSENPALLSSEEILNKVVEEPVFSEIREQAARMLSELIHKLKTIDPRNHMRESELCS